MQKILSLREKIILTITVCVVISAAAFNFLILPAIKKNASLNNQIYISREKLRKYALLLKQGDSIKAKYKSLSSGKTFTEDKSDPLVSALSEIEAIAKLSNIRIIDIRPQELKKQKEISIDFRAEGTIESYLAFIYNVENSLSLLRVKKFQLSAKPNAEALEGSFSVSKPQSLD